MNYLFFDIESIDRAHKTICTFGYVLTDTKFNILQKEEIIINPDLKPEEIDNWALRKIVKYDIDTIKTSPKFDCFYSKISALFQDNNCIVFGYGLENDITYVNSECLRYKKEEIICSKTKLCDIQILYKKHTGQKDAPALKKLVQQLGIATDHLVAHKSCDDAEMTMLVAKYLMQNMNINGRNIKANLQKYSQFI